MASRMMALAVRNTTKTQLSLVAARSASSSAQAEQLAKIGNRDVVGYGWNGEPIYQDRVDYPMPAIRFKENTPDVLVSTNKENFPLCNKWRKYFSGFERKGEGRLEEIVGPRKESTLPRFLLPDFLWNEVPNRRVENAYRSCLDRRFFGHLRLVDDVIVRWVLKFFF